jgi:plasmid stabilization system protein ParE
VKLLYTDRSRDDLDIALAWYERQSRRLGFEFLDCVEEAVKSILDNPKMYRVRYSVYRGCLIRRLPFSVLYAIEDRNIIVHAIFDNRQAPEKRP